MCVGQGTSYSAIWYAEKNAPVYCGWLRGKVEMMMTGQGPTLGFICRLWIPLTAKNSLLPLQVDIISNEATIEKSLQIPETFLF